MQRKARPRSRERMAMVSVSLMRSMRLKSRIDAATYFWGRYQLGRGSTSRWRTVRRFWSAGFPDPLPPCIWPSSRRPSPNSMANPCYPSWVAGFSRERIPTGSGFFRARARKRSFHPLQHALVQVFLESVPIDASRKIPFGLGPWKCPNPYAVHEERFPIKRASIKIQPSGEFMASVKCGCGFGFTFSRTNDTDPKLPVVRNTRGFGPTWEAEAERLRQSGLRRSAIAKKMRIAFKTVEKLLKKRRRTRSGPAKIEEWRQEWSKILDQVPDRSCVLARRKNAALYAKLWRWDKEWLHGQSQPRNARFAAKSKVDWVKRDMEWSQILRAAAQEIKTSGLARRRITPSTIIRASGLSSLASRSYLDRLPTCRSVLNECSESSLDDSRERRLRAAVDEAREVRLPPKEWAFRLLSGLSGKELSPRLNAVLQEIVSDPGN